MNTNIVIFALFAMDVNVAYRPLRKFVLSPNAPLNDGVFNFVVTFAEMHVLYNPRPVTENYE